MTGVGRGSSRRRVLLAASTVASVLALAACGDGGKPAEPDEIARQAGAVGIAPALVYVTELDGFDLATQSVGPSGDDGMSATYLRSGGGSVELTTRRNADPSAPACGELADGAAGTLRCSVERGGVQVVLSGDGVQPATLRAAGEAVRVPTSEELERLFADVPAVPASEIERGDLPTAGDGAPIDPTGPGG